MEKALKQGSAQVWRSKLESAGIPVGLVQTVEEAEEMEQIRVRQMIFLLGGRKVPGNPVKFGAYDAHPAAVIPPALDADGARLRAEFKTK
jgi:CoA:oxalate CoA-transferase